MLSASHVNADGKKSALILKGMCIRCGLLGRFAAASPIVSKHHARNLINDPFIGHLIQRQWICFLPHAQQIEDPTIKSNNSVQTLNKCIQQSSGVATKLFNVYISVEISPKHLQDVTFYE